MKRYKLLDHTADIGIITSGKSLPEAFSNAAYAMFDIITDIEKVQEKRSFHIHVSAANIEDLLVVWLDELLYRYDVERLLFRRFVIEDMNEQSLQATVSGERIDLSRHEIKTEIKSVTYHQLKVEKADDDWKIQVIFDI